MEVFWTLLAILISIVGYFVYLSKKANSFWKERGVPYAEPYLFVGNMLDLLLMRSTQGQLMTKICNRFPDEPLVGFISFLKPILIVKDADYIEKVLIKDFNSFANRFDDSAITFHPMQVNLFNMTGKRWRATRNKLSPIFTSGKLKNMFNNNMDDIGTDLEKAVIGKKDCVDLRDIMGRFAMDTIGSYGFGINPKSLENPNTQFEEMGKNVLNFGPWEFIKFLLLVYVPSITAKLGLFFVRTDIQNYFMGIIKTVMAEREKNNVRRNDFVDLMIQLKTKGKIEIQTKDQSDDYLGINDENFDKENLDITITDDFVIGQGFVFLVAGFDAIASAIAFTLYELCKHPEIQTRLRKEIAQKIAEHKKLSFDTIKDMTYLDMCLKESLRVRSPNQDIMRECNEAYTFPNGLQIEKGQMVAFPIWAVHQDARTYPEPLKYDPERFHPDVHQRPCSFLAFGEGPRMCIAMRFAMLQIKFGLVKILMDYRVELNSKTKEPILLKPMNFIATPKNPVYFNLIKSNANID